MFLDGGTSISLERAEQAKIASVLHQERSTRRYVATFDPDWRWHQFLMRLPDEDGRASKEGVDAVFDFVEASGFGGKRLPPAVTFATDQGIRLIWTVEPHYLEVEVFPDKRFEWFYKNRATGMFEGTLDEPERSISEEFQTRLRLFRT